MAGLLLIAVLVLSLSTWVAVTGDLEFHAHDEGPNTAYALELYRGELPTVNTKMRFDPAEQPRMASELATMPTAAHHDIWTGNHPPLYYALCVPVVALADALGDEQVMLVGMRLVNAVGLALSVLLVGLIAFEMVPRRPGVSLLATAVAASCGRFAYTGGHVQNDGVAAATAALTVFATLRILRLGLTRRRLVLLTLAGTAAAAAKIPGVATVALCGAALFLGLLLRDRSRTGALRALGAAAVATVVPALAIGWFYVRNLMIYGDLTASGVNREKFPRDLRGTWSEMATDLDMWHLWFARPWTHIGGVRSGWAEPFVDVLALAAVAGLVVVAVRWVRHPVRPAGRTVLAWGLMAAYGATLLYNLPGFAAAGGGYHERYLLSLLPLTATVLAIGLLGLGDLGALVGVGSRRLRDRVVVSVATPVLLCAGLLLFLVPATGQDWFGGSVG
ncbi:hypothetical protein FB381_2418 [Nocardioides albertanoniae]|uniref:Dolichyl-phosphate-mannose-protein mannosyltransferase n=2 Tax=Nocardioides albertanoniae TaxID=1175486 RepID=A0A543A7F8_9ACTN|nr:hypothetical protein FB381_2418 [Nocardioides albertanoniae]